MVKTTLLGIFIHSEEADEKQQRQRAMRPVMERLPEMCSSIFLPGFSPSLSTIVETLDTTLNGISKGI